MKRDTKSTIIGWKLTFLVTALFFMLSHGYGQNKENIVIKNKLSGKEWSITNNQKLKIVLNNGHTIRGRLILKDSLLFVQNEIIIKTQIDLYNIYDSTYYINIDEIKEINEIVKKFFIGYDIIKELIDEHSLTIGYNIFKTQFITFSYGYTYPYTTESDLSPNQSEYPIFMYRGPTYRLGYEIHPNLKSYPYCGIDLYYKSLSFNNVNLYNEYDDNENTFTQSEIANVYGWHINGGFILNFSYFFINFSLGVGETTKFRNFTVSNSKYDNQEDWDGPVVNNGTYSQTQHYTSVIAGLNIGFRF